MVAGYSGDAGDAMTATQHWYQISNGMMFSTPGSDNDPWIENSCALLDGGSGWWFAGCSASNINLDYNGYWSMDGSMTSNVHASRMLVKLI